MAEITEERGRQLPVQWTITLGDLLTLLLCFFVVTLSSSKRSPPEKSQKLKQVEVQTSTTEGKANQVLEVIPKSAGTLLANEHVRGESSAAGGPTLGATLSLQDLPNETISAQAGERLESLLATENIDTAEIVTCADVASQTQAWEQSMKRSLAISQFLHTVRPGLMIEVRMLGPECSQLGKESTTPSGVVAVVTAHQIGKKPHG